jgi:hypothetical protein
MVTIRHEKITDIAALETLLDRAFGDGRLAKSSERLRENRLTADKLSFDHGALVGARTGPHQSQWPARAEAAPRRPDCGSDRRSTRCRAACGVNPSLLAGAQSQ